MNTSFNYAKELFRHNMVRITFDFVYIKSRWGKKTTQVIFQNGDDALQVFTQLIDIIPEARLNLVIYYLKHGIF